MRLESAGWLPTVTPRTHTCRRWDSNLVQWRQRQGLSGSMAASCLRPQSLPNVRETRTEGRHVGTQLETGPQGDSRCSHSEQFCKCQWKHQSVDWKLQANSSEEANPPIWNLWVMRLNGPYRVVLHHQNDLPSGLVSWLGEEVRIGDVPLVGHSEAQHVSTCAFRLQPACHTDIV